MIVVWKTSYSRNILYLAIFSITSKIKWFIERLKFPFNTNVYYTKSKFTFGEFYLIKNIMHDEKI